MVKPLPKVPHIITIDNDKFTALLPDIYDDIKTVVGIAKAPDPDDTVYKGRLTISKAIEEGHLIRINCRLKDNKVRTVLCIASKFTSAMGGLLPKKVAGQDVKTTNIPRRMRLG
ncbi:hypothetical protein NIES4072_32280 [Nostoc commune NIES-4072]|uniref:Uncharacterized protein n=1 Tax=Nostoc commune NIES-4072 TaxID=2005467 RepID=A0A2R5FLA3_NOSCO|nr:hypothetical protein [Nostoc commune]BBD69439.1 hypothetical protein NIES4070_58480 [Nostoc commune HK-02]GBG19560.1 hypothetical protein NIES4072_32280 [Nostoc commune NIES-4072]